MPGCCKDMILCNVISSVGQALLVLALLLGIIAVLVCLHCGSEYLMRHSHKDRYGSHRETEKLRREVENEPGISRHSLFYNFFFRE